MGVVAAESNVRELDASLALGLELNPRPQESKGAMIYLYTNLNVSVLFNKR